MTEAKTYAQGNGYNVSWRMSSLDKSVFNTNVPEQATYEDANITITASCEGWEIQEAGIHIGENKPLTITAKSGKTISMVEFHCAQGENGDVPNTSVSAGILDWTDINKIGYIDNVNATTVSMSNTTLNWFNIDQITVYYQ